MIRPGMPAADDGGGDLADFGMAACRHWVSAEHDPARAPGVVGRPSGKSKGHSPGPSPYQPFGKKMFKTSKQGFCGPTQRNGRPRRRMFLGGFSSSVDFKGLGGTWKSCVLPDEARRPGYPVSHRRQPSASPPTKAGGSSSPKAVRGQSVWSGSRRRRRCRWGSPRAIRPRCSDLEAVERLAIWCLSSGEN